jgi:glutathione S-transferase
MMRLFYSPFHSFIHKSLVVLHETGLTDQVIYVATFPFRNTQLEDVTGQYPMTAINPLGKVPTLTLDDGTALYGSQCIVEYLDSLSARTHLFPPPGPARWDALRRLAMGDTLFDLAVQMSTEGRIPPADPRPGLFQ